MVVPALAFLASHVLGILDHYVDPNGDDRNDGLSAAHAWRTLNRVNDAHLASGDGVVLASGASFEGCIALGPQNSRTPTAPLVIRSAGVPFARIVSTDKPAISASGGAIQIRDLVLIGGAKGPRKDHRGIYFRTEKAPQEGRYHGIDIENVDVSGFGDDGIAIAGADKSVAGYDGIRIARVQAHDNYGSGISTWDDSSQRERGYAHRNLVITDCIASNNHSGSGIVVSGVDGGRVEYCRATGNEGKGGGVGIWAWSARNIQFRSCIADQTKTGGGDGGGFDLDGACINCSIENCLAYENAGPGYMHCDYPWATPTQGNVIRHCVSFNDGRKAPGNEIGFGFVTWGSGLDDCIIERNLAIATQEALHPKPFGMLFVSYIFGSQAPKEKPHVRGCTMGANVVLVACPGVVFFQNGSPKSDAAGVRVVGNRFLETGGLSLAGAQPANPPLADLTKASYRLTDPRQLAASPLIRYPERL